METSTTGIKKKHYRMEKTIQHPKRISSDIKTSYEPPPIPFRSYDWSAVRENYDEGNFIGYGKTEEEAINNLIELEN